MKKSTIKQPLYMLENAMNMRKCYDVFLKLGWDKVVEREYINTGRAAHRLYEPFSIRFYWKIRDENEPI